MSTKSLIDRWLSNNDRPQWVQTNRVEIEAATGLTVPTRLHEIDDWLSSGTKGAVTRKLRAIDADADADADAGPAADVNEDENQ